MGMWGAGRTEEHCSPAHFSHSLLFSRLSGVGSCQHVEGPGQFSFQPVQSRLAGGLACLPILYLHCLFCQHFNLRVLCHSLVALCLGLWQVYYLLSTKARESRMGVWFHTPGTIDFIFLKSVQRSGGTEVSNHPVVWTVSKSAMCAYNLFSICQEEALFCWAVIFWYAPFKMNGFVCTEIYNSDGETAIKCKVYNESGLRSHAT